MWWKLLVNSFRRNIRRKAVAIAAVALATCLATFLLHWSLNLGDNLQRDLRSYGTNIMVVPQGESLPLVTGGGTDLTISSNRYLNEREMEKIPAIFWKNQIVGMAPLLSEPVLFNNRRIVLVGTEFGTRDPVSDLRKVAPYLEVQGRWPAAEDELLVGASLAASLRIRPGDKVTLRSGEKSRVFRATGVIRSGGSEDHQMITHLKTAQELTGRPEQFKQLLISALVTPTNALYEKYQRNPDSLTPQEYERYSCTPFVSAVAGEIAGVFTGAEPRIIRQISQTEERVVKKVNWLMILVTLAALVAASLTMTSTTTAMILERRKELALMKAIGSNNTFLLLYLFSEIVLLGAIGSVTGYFLGSFLSVGLSRAMFETPLELKWIALPVVSFIGILIILLGSLWPLRQATSLEPAHALKDL